MAQGILPFKYENEKQKSHMTAYGGLPLYLDLAHVMGLRESVEKHLGIRRNSHGWRDSEIVMSLILLNLSGGDCVEDLNRFESDDGFCGILDRTQMHGMSRRERRALGRRWRKEKRRSVPSPSSVFRYFSAFHDPFVKSERGHEAFGPWKIMGSKANEDDSISLDQLTCTDHGKVT